MQIKHYEDGNEYIQRIDHILQRSVITELLMSFLPLEEWGESFMLAVEEHRPPPPTSASRRLLGGKPAASEGEVVVVTAAVVAFIANVRVLLFDAPPGAVEPIVNFLLENNVKFPNNSVAGPARVVSEFCQLWALKTGYKYTSFRDQRVYGIQELPRFPSKLKKPNARLRKASHADASAIAHMYSAFLEEMRTSRPGGYLGAAIGPHDDTNTIGGGKRVSTADAFIVNSFINEGKVYLLEDVTVGNNRTTEYNGILSMLFVGDIKQDASAEISMIYTTPARRRQGLASLLITEASKKMFDEGLCFIFVLEDPQVGTRNYKFFVDMGFRLEEFQTVCNLVDEQSPPEKEGIGEEYFYQQTPETDETEYPRAEWADSTSNPIHSTNPTPPTLPPLPSHPPPTHPPPTLSPLPSTESTIRKPLPTPPKDKEHHQGPTSPRLPPVPNKGPPPPLPSRAGRRPSIPVPAAPEVSQARSRPMPPPPRGPLPRLPGPSAPVSPTQNSVAAQKARFSVILSQTIEKHSVRGPRPAVPPLATATTSTPSEQTTPTAPVHSVRSPRAPGQPPPVLERFGGAIPVLPMPFGQPPMPARHVPPRPEPQGDSAGGGPALHHPTKQRPMMPGRRLPTPQNAAQRQQRIQSVPRNAATTSTAPQHVPEALPASDTPAEKETISFLIPQTQTIQSKGKSYTVYLLQVTRSPSGDSYTISRRYSQFLEFHKKITKRVSASLLPPFPGKKLFNSRSESVVEERRTMLLNYMNNLIAMSEVMALCSDDIDAFLQRVA